MTQRQHTDKVGLWPMVSLVTGNLVGSGVYLLPAILAPFGIISLWGWGATSCGAILLALVFAQLSARITKTGGPYLYAREAFGDTVGYYVAWGYWVLSWISNPTLAIAAVGYLSMIVGGLSPLATFLLEFLLIAGFTVFNLLGMKVTGRFSLIITSMKVVPLILLPLIGLFSINPDYFLSEPTTDISFGVGLNSVAFITLWAFIGLETGTVPSGQVKDPKKTVPRATVVGTTLAAVIYIFGTIAIMGVVPPEQLANSKAPYADAASFIFGGNWAVPVAITAIITCMGTLNGWTLIVGRIPYGAAQDGLFPEVFKKTTSHGTPYAGVLISSFCTLPLLMMSLSNSLIEQFQFIVDVAVTLILVVYAVSVLAYFKILYMQRDHHLGHILLGVGALIFAGWALWAANTQMILMSLTLVALGIPMHLWMKRVR